MKTIEIITPGEILLEEFIKPYEINPTQLAASLGVPPNRISAIVNGKREITADTALRLARFFGTTAEFWLNLQARYNLEIAQGDTTRMKEIKSIKKVA